MITKSSVPTRQGAALSTIRSGSGSVVVTGREVRDWSLITGRGGLQNGKIAGPKLFAPPPQDTVKLFVPPL